MSGRDDQNVGSQDDARRGQFQPMNLPAGGRPSGSRAGDADAPPAGRSKDRATPPPPASGAPRFGGPGNQFRPLPRYGEAGGNPEPPREHFQARHAPRDNSYPGYVDESYELPAARSRGSLRDERNWDSVEAPRLRGGRDPWDRDWASWSVAGYSEEVDAYARSDGEWEHWDRSAWGHGPDEGTMASVAVMVAPGEFSRKSKAAGQQKPFAELVSWAKTGFARSVQPSKAAVRLLVVLSILGTLFLSGAGLALGAYSDYAYLKGLASSGQAALTHVGQDLGLGSKSTKGQKVDPAHASMAQGDINLAISDFQAIHDKLQHPDFLLAVGGNVPKVKEMLQSTMILSSVATDGAKLANSLFPALIVMANIVNASPISTSSSTADTSDIVSASDFLQIKDAIPAATPYINQMTALIQSTPPDILTAALNAKQQKELKPLLQLVPQIQPALGTLSDFLNVAPQLLGIGTGYDVGYLLMTLDSAEMRPVGGFQGQYAVIGVRGGRVGHISLSDVYKTLEPFTNTTGPTNFPTSYDNLSLDATGESWFANTGLGWAMRNSGLSPDFNQDARYALWYLHNENTCIPLPKLTRPVCTAYYNQAYIPGGDHLPLVDKSGKITGYDPSRVHLGGTILVQSRVIGQLIDVVGGIKLGCPYNQTVTSQNLASLTHYYQETDAGRKVGASPCAGQLSDATKRFTATIAQALQDRIKNVPKGDLLTFAGELLQDLHTKDIQIYLSDPAKDYTTQATPYIWNQVAPYQVYPENVDAMAFLEKYHAVNDFYGTVDAKGTPIPDGANVKFDDSLTINRANIQGWKMEPYISLKLVDAVTIDHRGNATHTMKLVYIFTIPPIKTPNPITFDSVNKALFDVVNNAAYSPIYQEYVRLYTNPHAQLQASNILGFGSSDVPNRRVFASPMDYGSRFSYTANVDYTTGTVTWSSPLGTDPAITSSWYVPSVVKNGVYTLHMERQSGVTMSYDVTVACASNPDKTIFEAKDALTQDVALKTNVANC